MSELLFKGRIESSSGKKLVSLSFFIVRSNFKVRLAYDFGLVLKVRYENFFGKYF